MPRSRQMYRLSSTLQLPHYIDAGGKLYVIAANDVPMFQWPDGSWCHEANRFIRELMERRLSRVNRGGSLATFAAHISHLLRYVWTRKILLSSITDSEFTTFIDGLLEQDSRRSSKMVVEIGRTCLQLIRSVGAHAGDMNTVSETGRIRIYLKRVRSGRNSARTGVGGLNHASFPRPEPRRRRMPTTRAAIDSLIAASESLSTTPHQRMRRLAMLRLMEITGARRGELASLTTEAVKSALAMERPMLRLITLKTRSPTPPSRLIPVSRRDIEFINTYIDIYRSRVIAKHLRSKDHGYVLVNGRDGRPLQSGTLTQEVAKLASQANLRESVSPHLFRHRFITRLFVALIEQHEMETEDQFRRALLEGETLRFKVSQWTGHRDLGSLDHYIHLAFDEAMGARGLNADERMVAALAQPN
ncbi:site-specific integrase [Stenotrophomonas sp. TWI809]|uniref:tyrosine-type recombinase/integrase n=1 Tax=Stenotrophomonas sp. TWI809 TaxID=3136796 RepID=UPI003207FDA2